MAGRPPLELKLEITEYTPFFPVTLDIEAFAEKTILCDDGVTRVVVEKEIYRSTTVLGVIDLEKIMAKKPVNDALGAHPHANLCVVTSGWEMKLPKVIPEQYGMVTARISITVLTTRERAFVESDMIMKDAMTHVTQQMKKLAECVGGTMPFTLEDEQKAVAQAQAERSTTDEAPKEAKE